MGGKQGRKGVLEKYVLGEVYSRRTIELVEENQVRI